MINATNWARARLIAVAVACVCVATVVIGCDVAASPASPGASASPSGVETGSASGAVEGAASGLASALGTQESLQSSGQALPDSSGGTLMASSGNSLPAAQAEAMAAVRAAAEERAIRDEQAKAKPNLLACVGDSITYGLGIAEPEENAWPALLGAKLGEEWGVLNLGVSGTTLRAEGMSPYLDTGELARLDGADPTIIIVMLGSNDGVSPTWDVDSYKAQYASLVESLASQYPGAEFVLMAPPRLFTPDASSVAAYAKPASVIADEIRPAVAQLAEALGARFVDLYGFTEDHPEWFPDHLHPNEEGHAAIASYLFEQLLR